MRALTSIIIVLLIFFNFCFANQDNTADSPTDEQKTVEVPKIDLHAAIVTDNIDAIKQHIKAGSDINMLEPSRGSTPLITAAFFGKTEIAKMLIDAGADLNYKNADGSTALHTAIVFDRAETAKLLIDSGIDVNIQNNNGATALHTAAFFCRIEIVKALLEKGADKSLKNKYGQTALQSIEGPFEAAKPIYDAIGGSLKPMGLNLDYERIEATRPQIVELLK